MTEIQEWWESEYERVSRDAIASKNSMQTLFDMYERYEALNNTEKNQIDNLLVEWIEGEKIDKRFIAIALISEYKIVSAIPALERLSERLKDAQIPDDPRGYHERQKVIRKLESLRKT